MDIFYQTDHIECSWYV